MSYHKVGEMGALTMAASVASKPLVRASAKKTVSRVGTLVTKTVSDPAYPSLLDIAYEVRGDLEFVTPEAQLLVFNALSMMSWSNLKENYCDNCDPKWSTTKARADFMMGQTSGNGLVTERTALESGFAVLIEKASIISSAGIWMNLIVTNDVYEIRSRASTGVTVGGTPMAPTHALLDAPEALLNRAQGAGKPVPAVDCANPPPGVCGPPDAMARWSIEQCKCVYPQDKGGDQPAGQQQMSVASSSKLPTWVVPVAVAAGGVAVLAVIVAATRKSS